MSTIKGPVVGLHRRVLRRWGAILAGLAVFCCAVPAGLLAQGGPPLPTPPGEILNIFHFDDTNTWLSTYGFPPKAFSGIVGVPSWQSNAVLIAGSRAFLQYNESETNGN